MGDDLGERVGGFEVEAFPIGPREIAAKHARVVRQRVAPDEQDLKASSAGPGGAVEQERFVGAGIEQVGHAEQAVGAHFPDLEERDAEAGFGREEDAFVVGEAGGAGGEPAFGEAAAGGIAFEK